MFVFGTLVHFMLFSIQIIHNANSTQSLSPNPTQPTSNLTDPFPIFTSKILNHPFSIHLRSGSYIYIYILRFLVSFSHTLSLVLMHFILILTIMDVNFNVFLDSMQQLKVDTCWMKVKQNQQRFVTIYN